MKLVSAADAHLSLHAWRDRPELSGDTEYSFQQLIDFTLSQPGVEGLLLLGDILDAADPPPEIVDFLLTQLKRLEGICPVYFITGQHEQHAHGLWLGLSKWATHLDRQILTFGEHLIYGLDWQHRTEATAALQAIPAGVSVLAAHQVWAELCPSPDCSCLQIPHVTTLLTGDYHKHLQRDAIGADGQTVRILSHGSMAMQAIDEPPDKFFYMLDHDLSAVSIELHTRVYEQFELQTDDDLQAMLCTPIPVVDHLPAKLQRPIRHVYYADSLTGAYTALTDAFGDDTHLFLSPVRTRVSASVLKQQDHGPAVFGNMLCVLDELLPEERPAKQIVSQLLEIDDRRDLLAEVINKLEEQALAT